MKKFSICLLMLLVVVFIFPGAGQAKLTPGDYIDLKGHWAEQDILLLDQLGIMHGMGTTEQGYKIFAPGSLVTRAQMAKVLTDTFQLDYGQLRFFKQPVASDYYKDVDNNSWYADAVVMCAINEIFYARDQYNFEPAGELSRIEVAQAIYRSFNAKNISIPMIMMMPVYNDTQNLEQEDMNAMVFVSNTGIMKGDGQNFRPVDSLTRAELAKIIGRCIELISLNENTNGQDYAVKVGQEFFLSLPSNPSTGYVWDFNKSIDDKLLELKVDKAYKNDTNENIVGQAGKTYWKFKALQAGTTEIELRYARPWESVQPAKTFKITININDGTSSPDGISVQTKAYNNLAKYMETNLQMPYLQGLVDEAMQSKLNDRFEQDAFGLEKSLQTEVEEYVKEAQASDFPIRNFSLYSRYQQGYLNSRILSLTVDYYQYTGGAHGITERRPYNIDLGTGQDLALKDLFSSNFDYRSVINKEIRRQIDGNKDIYFEGDMGFQGISEDHDYYLQDDALVVVFQQYEIAPYAVGIPEFIIPISLFGDNFRTDLLKVSK